MTGDSNLAVFCDFENIALGVRDAKLTHFDIRPIVERLLLKGSIVAKKAYCDWQRYKEHKPTMHEAAFELIEIPHARQSGKNSADIRDGGRRARPLLHEGAHRHVRHRLRRLRLLAPGEQAAREREVGDRGRREERDLRPPGEQLRRVHLLRRPGGGEATARRRSRSRARGKGGAAADKADRKTPPAPTDDPAQKGLDLVVQTAEAIYAERGDQAKLWGSMIKQTLKRRRPGFNESAYGFRSFNDLLEEAQSRGQLDLDRDERSGGYVITGIGGE